MKDDDPEKETDEFRGSSANLSTDDLHHDIEAYRMEKKPRGKCIIINNIAFDNRTDIREGAEHDAKAMESLFRKLHFYVTVYRDVTAEDLELLLSRAAMADEQKDADCLIVILMSHGAKGVIASKDGKTIPLSSGVYRWFNKDFCPALGGKPKLFFIQACRKCGCN
ncbi:caspase-2-like [Haemaphysalis longicornis]